MKKGSCFISALLIIALLIPPFSAIGAQTITIDDAKSMAVENSSGLQEIVINKIKKQIALKQAKEGVQDSRKKENTVRFSLLFSIKWPEKHAMPKEIELLMKIPQVSNELTILEKQEIYETMKSQYEAEQNFYNVVQEIHNEKYLKERIADSTQVLARTEEAYKQGRGKREDVEYVQTQLRDFETSAQKSLMNIDSKKKILGTLLGIEARYGYDFQEYWPKVDISRQQLNTIIEFTKKNDFELFKKTQERKLAERDTQEILQIYNKRYSKYIGDINNYLKTHEGKKINYNEFIQLYNHALTRIDSPWAKTYVINLLFFKIYIPKEWFKGEYSGTRYMEDQKYALFISIAEREKAILAEKTAISALEDKIYLDYSIMKQMEDAYNAAEKSLAAAEESYKKQLDENKRGLVSFTSLESARDALYSRQNSLYDLKIEYSKQISSFNFGTSGYVNALLNGTDLNLNNLEAGVTSSEMPRWFVKNELTQYTFQFGVTVPENYEVDSYQLYYGDIPVGGKLDLKSMLIHMPLAFDSSQDLSVRLYQGEQLKYTASLDDGTSEGVLIITPASEVELPIESKKGIGESIGTWNVSPADSLRSKFSINTNTPISYTEYEVLSDKVSLGKAMKNKEITTLSLYFSNTDSLTVKLYENGIVVGEAQLKSDKNLILTK